ncbi:MAG: glycosyltransferase family 2 protein [Bacteroidia bacterium]
MTEQNKISIIIVNYNVKDFILACLDSVCKFSDNLNLEIIVVDNNSTDGSAIEIKKKFPQVILIENNFNAGFSGANNQGIKASTGDFIFLLNPDTEVCEHALTKLFEFAQSNKSKVIIAPQLLNTNQSIQPSAWKNPSIFNLISGAFFLHHFFNFSYYYIENYQHSFEAKTLSGAALFFHKNLIRKIGFLDENLFWMEDIDFCYRAQSVGEIYYFSESKIIHHGGQSSIQNYKITISNQLMSKLKFFKKHTRKIIFLTAYFFVLIHIILHIFIFSMMFPFSKLARKKWNAYIFTLKKYFSYIINNDLKIV